MADAGSLTLYAKLADAFLGKGVRPFAGFRAPADMRANFWYGSSFAMAHADLASILVRETSAAAEDAWVLEAGSFIGGSATVWAQAARSLGRPKLPVVCLDTWLGDLLMWEKKGNFLGRPGPDGTPRLFEQFMLNVAAQNASEQVLPVRMPALQGLEYIRRRVAFQGVPPPSVIYLDTAHTYPDTIFEIEAAWRLLRPGGYLTGDDFTHYFPPVQQSLNEWISSKPRGSFEDPTRFAAAWGRRQKMRMVRILTAGDERNESVVLAPFVLRLPGQWVIKKPLGREGAAAEPGRQSIGKAHLTCCLNGWADPDTAYTCDNQNVADGGCAPTDSRCRRRCKEAAKEATAYTRCNPPALPLQQETCHLPAARSRCIAVFACRSARAGAEERRQGGVSDSPPSDAATPEASTSAPAPPTAGAAAPPPPPPAAAPALPTTAAEQPAAPSSPTTKPAPSPPAKPIEAVRVRRPVAGGLFEITVDGTNGYEVLRLPSKLVDSAPPPVRKVLDRARIKTRRLSDVELFGAGLLGGVAAEVVRTVLLHPLDTAKTRLQQPPAQADAARGSAGKPSRRALSDPSLFSEPFAGLAPALASAAPQAGVYFATREVVRRQLFFGSNVEPTAAALLAITAGTMTYWALGELAASARELLVLGARAYPTCVVADLPPIFARVLAYQAAKSALLLGGASGGGMPMSGAQADWPVLQLADEVAAAVGIACVVAAITTPLDVLRTRTLALLLDAEGEAVAEGGAARGGAPAGSLLGLGSEDPTRIRQAAAELRELTRREGISALYSGAVPRVLWNGVCVGALTPLRSVGFYWMRDGVILELFDIAARQADVTLG